MHTDNNNNYGDLAITIAQLFFETDKLLKICFHFCLMFKVQLWSFLQNLITVQTLICWISLNGIIQLPFLELSIIIFRDIKMKT